MPLITQIGADASQYNKVMAGVGATAQTAATGITNSFAGASNSINTLGGTAMSASMRFQTMRSGMSAARDGVIGLTMSGQRADSALMAMGHHFTTLVSETGSLGGAFKALGSSLLGVGGVILAVTLASELWNKYSKSQKDAKDATADYVSTLDSVRQAQLKGQQDGEGEITRLSILYNATQNHTLSLQDRNLAYDELEKKYPKFFTNAEREKTLLGENKQAYNDLATAILAAASAKAYEQKIGENANRAFEDTQKKNDALKEYAELQKKVDADAIKNEGRPSLAGASTFGTVQDSKTLAGGETVERMIELRKQIADLNGDQTKLFNQNETLKKMALASEVTGGFKTGQQIEGKNDKLKHTQTQLQSLEAQYKELQDAEVKWIEAGNTTDPFNLTPLEHRLLRVAGAIDDIKEKLKPTSMEATISSPTQKSIQNIKYDTSIKGNVSDKEFDKAKQSLKELIALRATARIQGEALTNENKAEANSLRELTSVIGSGLTSAFNNALSGGQNFFQSMGQWLVQLVEKLIAAIATAAVLAAVLSFTGLGAAAGMSGGFSDIFSSLSGLSALTGGSSLTTSVLPKHAEGGIATRATAGIFGEAGPEALIPLSHMPSMMSSSGHNSNGLVATITGSNLQLWDVRSKIQKGRIG